jgi:hypothetical protein
MGNQERIAKKHFIIRRGLNHGKTSNQEHKGLKENNPIYRSAERADGVILQEKRFKSQSTRLTSGVLRVVNEVSTWKSHVTGRQEIAVFFLSRRLLSEQEV